MKVKVFDESHEKDLEESINNFLKEETEVIDIKFDVSVLLFLLFILKSFMYI